MNKTLFKQADSRWGSKPYPSKGSSFAGNGCGCVACTHLIIENEKYKSYTPEPIRKWMVSQGYAVYNQGTTWSGIPATLKHYGYSKVVHIDRNDPMSKAWTELNKGDRIGIILFLGGKAPNGMVWTAGGHYVAFTDYYVGKDGRHYFYTKDSGGRNNDSLTNGYYSYERSMKGLVYQMWIVERPKAASMPTTPSTPTTPAAEPTKDSIAVDGKFGPNSIKALQKILGTTQDGKIGGQLTKLKKYHTGFTSGISYGTSGSATVRALQKLLKLSGIDGQLGPNTIKSFQLFLGMSNPDWYWGPNTSKAVQKWINKKLAAGTFPVSITPPQSTIVKIKGVDISAWQGSISKANFEKAKANGIKYVILRVGYTGSSSKKPTIDKVFENNYKNAIAAGLPVGIYYYSLATTTSLAKAEAEFVVKNLKDKKITYPVYIDVEDNATQGKASKSALASVCNTFCEIVAAAGYKPGVYASISWFNSRIGAISASHTKWVAQYYSKCEYKGAYDMWQYSSSEKVPGIADKVDVNWCYKKF
jgi:GH25 family lysozyme M1 (1,4-beta-N-acetylmuramidase)